ncbi:MAG: hypothetical protein JW832_17810 [Deltaproteobacteria bacterium]|nr:hypothetical protein [Deltaproteobacteria bacterium]
MQIAYLILAHNNPEHLLRLIHSLSTTNSSFFIHIDKKTPFYLFERAQAPNVFFSKRRITVHWGEFSLVEATLHLIQQALNNPCGCDYLVLLSGVDYPLQSPRYIENFFQKNRGGEFINLVTMPCEAAGKHLSRLTEYHLQSTSALNRLLKKTACNTRLLRRRRDYRKILKDFTPCAGSQWWALSREACHYILRFTETEPDICDFYRNTLIPDEMFFQTILGNSVFKQSIAGNSTFSRWSGGRNPAILHLGQLESLQPGLPFMQEDVYGKREVLFARKFTDSSAPLIAELDTALRQKETSWLAEEAAG